MRLLSIAILAALILAPAVSAHTSVVSSDGKYRVVIGQLNEPVVTYAKTGLDICFQMNTSARDPVTTVNPGVLAATLVSPGGERLSQDLRAQFGRPGCYQFQEPYVLTQPGQYFVDLNGTLDGTAIDFQGVGAGGAVVNMSAISFPDETVATSVDLTAMKADKTELDALRTRVQALEAQLQSKETSKGIPMPAAILTFGLLGAMAIVRRRRLD